MVQSQKTHHTILDVEYTHIPVGDEGDLYLTEHGLPAADCLKPANYWLDKEWFAKNSERLSGTSTVYRITTKPVDGRSKTIVLKWNRMGQDVPLHEDIPALATARFNSPFEEFSLVNELRGSTDLSGSRFAIHKPLAIYVPAKRVELCRVGRRESAMKALIEKHVEIDLDMNRTYAVIYEWMDGIDATQAQDSGLIDEEHMRELTLEGDAEMKRHGFEVRDRKPHHVILRFDEDGAPLLDSDGRFACGLIDFELLARTGERERVVRRQRRTEYLKRQRDRFASAPVCRMPEHLSRSSVLGVDYVYGHCESTDGALWVVGKDPALFEFFLPERWEKAPRTRLSSYSEIYHTLTKDNVNLVWKVSKVGVQPDVDPFIDEEWQLLSFGYNSPFEEMSLAMDLTSAGIATIYPRAIYMTGLKTQIEDAISDPKRYETHAQFVTPDDYPVLRKDRDYITIWGYWNGPDEKLAAADRDHYRSINALRAMREDIITDDTYYALMRRTKNRLLDAGIEDLNLRGSHLLLASLASTGDLIMDDDGLPEVRICSFELLRRIDGG